MAKRTARDEDISRLPQIKAKLLKLFDEIDKGFEAQRERADEIMDYWDVYNCVLGPKQFYNGNSKLYVPIVKVAINARKTRFVNQMFPQNGRFVDVTSTDEDLPMETVALIEHYVRDARLRTQVMPALCVAGDVEGQYNVYIHWEKVERHVVSREIRPVEIGGVDVAEAGEVETIVEETIEDAGPCMEVLPDADVLVVPATADSITQALEVGGCVVVVRRWTKTKIQQLIDDGEILEEEGEELLEAMDKVDDQQKDTKKMLASVAGIKNTGGSKIAVTYEVWSKLKVDGEQRICRSYLGGSRRILGCKLNPYWCDRVPVLSAPVEKIPGSFKGRSLIQPGVLDLQIQANDAINEAMDSLSYSLAPITAVDPEKVARWPNLVLEVGAVWPVPPEFIKELKFTNVTAEALQVVAAAKAQIFEALGVNPSMLPQQTGRPGTKRNQAEVALEQQVDILTTADAVTNIEGEILTPFVQRALDYDHQFRTKDIRVKMFGPVGQRANMQLVKPIQMHRRYTLSWLGVEAARDAARIQQQISFFGVLQKMPPTLYPGHRLNAVPLIARSVENVFGPSLGSQVFERVDQLYTVDAEQENEMLMAGFPVKTHPLDDDPRHIREHMQLLQTLQPGSIEQRQTRDHIQHHQQAMQLKAIQAMGAGAGGSPGAPPRGPQPGAQPAPPRQGKAPPGAIHPDQMVRAGALVMPRKM
jgi:hypothetical protein